MNKNNVYICELNKHLIKFNPKFEILVFEINKCYFNDNHLPTSKQQQN